MTAIIAGKYDMEAIQHQSLDLYISYVNKNDNVLDFSLNFSPDWPENDTLGPDGHDRAYGLVFTVRPKKEPYTIKNAWGDDLDVEENGVLIDSINDFDLEREEVEGDDGRFDDDLSFWLGKSWDGMAIGQAELHMQPITNPTDLKEYTFHIKIPNSVMREMEPGTYYYDIDLVKRESPIIAWEHVYTDGINTTITEKLLYGKFRVLAAMNRDVEEWV